MKQFIAFLLGGMVLFASSPVLAAKPSTPGNGGGFNPIPNSVCIDPGHGGSESGAVNNDLLEKNVNLEAAVLLRNKLTTAGYTVFMTREGDETLSNADRYNYCNNQRAAILISIHHNGSTTPSVDYTTALYGKRADISLAEIVAGTVSAQLGLDNHGVSRFASGVLLKSDMPATISEGFFLTNSDEYELIKTGNRLETETDALFAAVETYLNSN